MDYYQAKIKYRVMTESGKTKIESHVVVFKAQCYTDAEAIATGFVQNGGFSDYSITNIKKVKYTDEIITGRAEYTSVYIAKLDNVIIHEKTGNEKHCKLSVLVTAQTFEAAQKAVCEYINSSMCDLRLIQLTQSNINQIYKP